MFRPRGEAAGMCRPAGVGWQLLMVDIALLFSSNACDTFEIRKRC